MKMKSVQLFSVLLLILMQYCKKENPPAKIFVDCELQYENSKWLQKGDSIVVPICGGQPPVLPAGKLDSVSFTYISPGSSITCTTCYNIQLMNRRINYITDFLIGTKSEYIFSEIGGIEFKIEKFNSNGIQFTVWYNHK